MRKRINAKARVSADAPVFLAAVLEYLCAEIIELSSTSTLEHKKKTINPRFISLAIKSDEELSNLLKGCHINAGGVLPGIHPKLLPKRREKMKK